MMPERAARRRGVAFSSHHQTRLILIFILILVLILIRVKGHGYGDPVTGRRLHFGHPGGLEHLHLTNESGKVWNFKYKLIDERYVDLAETWRIDFGHEVFQILASTSEIETGKGGEGHRGRQGFIPSSIVMSRKWGVEINTEGPEMGQRGQACCHHVRRNVAGLWHLQEAKGDQANGRR